MSRILLALFILCGSVVAEKPKGFLGIHWGASPEEAKRVMQARPGVKFPEDTDDYRFELTGGTFAGQPVVKWVLEFPERKFASAIVTIKSEGGNGQDLYKDFSKRGRKQLAAIEKQLDDQPIASLLMAFAAGFVIRSAHHGHITRC